MIHQQFVIPLELKGTITTGDGGAGTGKPRWKAPYAGNVEGLEGWIKTLGSGAGTSTDIQLRNSTANPDRDILSTKGTFEVNSATNLLEGQVVDAANAAFAAGDVIEVDVDAISTGPADATLYMAVGMFVD